MKMRILKALVVTLCLLALTAPAFAQGCSMCYSSAAQQDSRAQQALNLGIFVLIVPPVLLFGGVLVTAFRRSAIAEIEPTEGN